MKLGVLVLVASESDLSQDARPAIHAVNPDLMVIPGGMISYLQILVNKPCNDRSKQLCPW
jgi:hypothetical protein